MVTQAFPLWGKQNLRREAALADLDAIRGRERAARDALDERIKGAFAQYYVASRALAVNREVIAVTRGMRAAAKRTMQLDKAIRQRSSRRSERKTAVEIEAARLEGDRAAAGNSSTHCSRVLPMRHWPNLRGSGACPPRILPPPP